jgi:hypothetical protein
MSISTASTRYVLNNKPVHYLVLGLLLLLVLYCLLSASSRGVANAWYFNAEFSLNDLPKQKSIKNKAEYEQILSSIKKAQSLDPTHPHYAHMVGRIMHLGVDMGFEDKAQLHYVKQWYLLATELRPLWPDPWVDLLRLNNYLYGYTDETKYYIDQALSTGPYIDLVTIGTIQVWLLNWSVLSGYERTQLFKQFDVATKQFKLLDVLKFAKAINREKLLCSQLKFNVKYQKQKDSYLYRRYCLQ